MYETDNPILDFSGLPRYAEVSAGVITPAVEEMKTQAVKKHQEILNEVNELDWQHYLFPFLAAHENISHAFKIGSHVHNVKDTQELLADYQKALMIYEDYDSDLWTNEDHYQKIKQLKESDVFDTLTNAQQVIVKRLIDIFEDNGVHVAKEKRPELKDIRQKLAMASTEFASQLQQSTDNWKRIITDRNQLAGLPDDIIDTLKDTENPDQYILTLMMPCYLPVMRFLDDRNIRQKMYCANVTRASENGVQFGHQPYSADKPDNSHFINLILQYRYQLADMLGYKNPAAQILKDRMLNSADDIIAFLRDLAKRARPYAEKEIEELKQYAKDKLDLDDFAHWDMAYVSEKLSQEKFGFSEQEVRQYFELKESLAGMFDMAQRLFGIDISLAPQPSVLHGSVQLYTVSQNDKAIAQFYVDPYARMHKHGGAWMDDVISRQRFDDGTVRLPVAQLVCNFTEPAANRPSLLSHDELLTLFHEFGHVIHHLLTNVDEAFVGGINGVEWDGVELPSQFMENFAWQWSVISELSRHAETGNPMPKALFDKLTAAKNFQMGMGMLRQIEFGLFDMYLHHSYDPFSDKESVQDILDRTRGEVAVVIPPEYNRFANSFGHIFAGGYGAGYYSYKWSEVLSDDAFLLFLETAKTNQTDIVSSELGNHFRQEILGVGSTRSMKVSFEAFRGRQPTIDAHLKAAFENAN